MNTWCARPILCCLLLCLAACAEEPAVPARPPEAVTEPVKAAEAAEDARSFAELLSGFEAPDGPELHPGTAHEHLKLLGTDDENARGTAVAALAATCDWWITTADAEEFVRRLAALLPEASGREKETILWVLYRAGPHLEVALDQIEWLLGSEEPSDVEAGLHLAGELGERAARLRSVVLGKVWAKKPAAAVLGSLGPPGPGELSSLLEGLDDASPAAQARVLRLLGDWAVADSRVLEAARARLDSEEDDIRNAALFALARVPGGKLAAVTEVIRRRAEGDRFSGADVDTNGPEVLAYLDEIIETETTTRQTAAVGLLPSSALGRFRRLFTDDDEDLRAAAAWRLLGREEPLPDEDDLLTAALRDPWPEVRRSALITIADRYEDTRSMAVAERVGPFLSDPAPIVRFRAGDTLYEIGAAPLSAVPAVRENLMSDDRLVRLGALRVVLILGPDAAAAVPELLPLVGQGDLGYTIIAALAATEVMSPPVRKILKRVTSGGGWLSAYVFTTYGRKVAFLVEEGRAALLRKPDEAYARALAHATDDPGAFAGWVEANHERLPIDVRIAAFENLGAAGLGPWLEIMPWKPSRALHEVRLRVREIGAPAAEVLLEVARGARPGPAAFATDLLGEVPEHVSPEVVLPLLDAEHRPVRRAAARTIDDLLRAGADPKTVLPALLRHLQDDAAVRAPVLHAIAATGTASKAAIQSARTSLGDADPFVRVAAADALFALTAETEGPLGVLEKILAGPATASVWFGSGGTPARTEDEYEEGDQLWAAAARTVGRIGPGAAPLAKTLVWAGHRHGEPRMQRILVDAVASMGPGAGSALPLLRRLDEVRSTWLGYHETVGELEKAIEEAIRALGG